MTSGRVRECWRYPVKSMQGAQAEVLDVRERGVVGDRRLAVIDVESGHVLSGKRLSALMMAEATDESLTLPDGVSIRVDDPEVSAVLSRWLGREVRLEAPDSEVPRVYDMTFDPPNDDADYVEIPVPPGAFVDLAPIHLVTTATLDACREARPDLDWDVRRFRPNLLVDIDGPMFVEHDWVGQQVGVGSDLVLDVVAATIRCAMPLRAQPGLDRQPDLYEAMVELNEAMPNHLGVYCTVSSPGVVRPGDPVTPPA